MMDQQPHWCCGGRVGGCSCGTSTGGMLPRCGSSSRDNTATDCCGDIEHNQDNAVAGCYAGCLNGLLHATKGHTNRMTATSVSSSVLQCGQYDLILDRPSLQKWWDNHRCQHNTIQSRGKSWDCQIIQELVRILPMVHSNICGSTDTTASGTLFNNHTTNSSSIDVTSVFISMDIFQNKEKNSSERMWSEHEEQQQLDLIQKVFSTLRNSLPKLQSVHLYNGPISGNIFDASRALDTTMDDLILVEEEEDEDEYSDDVTEANANDNLSITSPPRHENRLYHRWNRFNINTDDDNNDDDDDDDNVVDDNNRDGLEDGLDIENHMTQYDVDSDSDDDTAYPVLICGSTLASIVSSLTLQSITVTRCLCFHSANDVSVLAKSLQRHPSLCSIHLASMYLHPKIVMTKCTATTSEQEPCLDPLIDALSTVSQLESLNITLAKESRQLLLTSNPTLRSSTRWTRPPTIIMSPRCLQSLIAGTTIRDLTLWECLLDGSHLRAISDALLHGSSNSTGAGSCKDYVTSLKHEPKPTCLQFLSVRCNPNITCDDWCTFYTKTLPYCYSIQSIYNDHVCGLADCDPNLLNHGKNSTVREGIRFWDLDAPTATTSDETSSSSDLSTPNAAANAELYLGLNSLGRGSIIQGSYTNGTNDQSSNTELLHRYASQNDENFIDLLSDVIDTPSALYALIRGHPLMILSFIRRQS